MLRICLVVVLICLPIAATAGPNGKVRVIDADTWDVGNQRVRLFGIDAPEMAQTCTRKDGTNWACGKWSAQQVRELFEGKTARCTALGTDRYDRVVARCHVGKVDVAEEIVSAGYAFAYRRYSMDYDLVEKGAVVNNRGLHASRVQEPAEYRAARAKALQPSRQGCAIKGNISSKGTRIYHVPGQEHYDRTRISESKGERWFCSEADARNAGWRRARR